MQGVCIDRIYRIDHTKTYNFNAPTLVTLASHKIMAKMLYSLSKDTALTEQHFYATQFFVATYNVCPLAIPESCAHRSF